MNPARQSLVTRIRTARLVERGSVSHREVDGLPILEET
jgi:hypothetical protein